VQARHNNAMLFLSTMPFYQSCAFINHAIEVGTSFQRVRDLSSLTRWVCFSGPEEEEIDKSRTRWKLVPTSNISRVPPPDNTSNNQRIISLPPDHTLPVASSLSPDLRQPYIPQIYDTLLADGSNLAGALSYQYRLLASA